MDMNDVAPGGVVHPWEHRDALITIQRLREENDKLRKYAKYLAARMQDQAMTVNEKANPIIAASMLDDLDDAASIADIEPRGRK